MRWIARVVEHRPPHAVVFGEEARFVDEQEHGPFKSWRHEHDFEHVDEKTTRITDRVTYALHLGPIGWLVDLLIVRRQVKRMFRQRHEATRRFFEAVASPSVASPR
jgi:ligand-binding SRPBCC domain-containing protein